MLKKILIGLIVVIGIFAAVVATRPDTFKVERAATINAPAEVVFAYVNDFHKWDEWSPWSKIDPNMKKTIEGAPAGVGATYYWNGNDDVGEGRQTITESKPNEMVGIKLEFLKPFASTSQVVFALKPEADKTTVTWTMNGNNDFMGKAFSMFMDMDAMIGKDFDKGLAQMKTIAEAEATKRLADAKAAADKAAADAAAAAAGQPAQQN